MNALLMMPVDLYQGWPLVNDTIRHHQILPGCAFPQLAAMIPNHSVEIYDGLGMSLKNRVSKRFLADYLPRFDVIGMNVVSELVALNTEVNLRLIRRLAPKTKIIFGGFHSTFYHEEWCRRGADAVIRHEGEHTFRHLLDTWETNGDIHEVEGLTFRRDNDIVVNPDRQMVQSLDELPVPRFDLLDYSLYHHPTRKDGWSGTVETTRGCPHRCSYCWDRAMWKGRQRMKSAERVLQELEIVHRKGVRWLWFTDNNYGSNPSRDMKISEEMIRRGLDFSWGIFVRGDTIFTNQDLFEVAARAGLTHAAVGYEFSNPNMLNSTKKQYTSNMGIAEYREVYRLLKKNGIFTLGLYLTGFDESMKEVDTPSYSFALQTCDMATWNSLIPHRGTSLYDKFKQNDVPIKDLFYHIRLLSIYEDPIRFQKDPSFVYNLRSLIGLRTVRLGLLGTRHARAYIQGIWKMIIRNLFRVNRERVRNFWILVSKRDSPSQREKRIRSFYLSNSFLDHWLGGMDTSTHTHTGER